MLNEMMNCVLDEQQEELEEQVAAATHLPTAPPESPRDNESHVETQPFSQRHPYWASLLALLALLGGIVAAWLMS